MGAKYEMDLKEIGNEVVSCIPLVQDGYQYQAYEHGNEPLASV
jgi:hypothetical protein